ncbi:MAG: hypothetical protein ABI543_05135 [Ignavibacteria bacterium]
MPMGLNTTTFNIDELITSYADNQISDPETKKQIEELLAKDQLLNAKYRSEILTRDLYRTRFPQVELPKETYSKVISSIDGLIAGSGYQAGAQKKIEVPGLIANNQNQYPSFWQSLKEAFTEKFIGVPRYAFAVLAFVIIGGLVMFTGGKKTKNPYILSGTESSIMVQAVNSFHKFVKGDVKPQLSTSNAAEIEKYVMEKAHFNPYVPEIDNYQISGVVCDEYRGQQLVHLVYKDSKGDILYIMQVPVTAVQKKNMDLPDDVQKEIIKAKFYMCDEVDENNCTLLLWYKGNNVCASMTTMPKQEMYAAFTRFNK